MTPPFPLPMLRYCCQTPRAVRRALGVMIGMPLMMTFVSKTYRSSPVIEDGLEDFKGKTASSSARADLLHVHPKAVLGGGTAWQIKGVGDFNGDIKADILWRKGSTGDVQVWLMNGNLISDQGWVGRVADMNWRIEN